MNNIPTAEEFINNEGFATWFTSHSDTEGEVVINYQDCLQITEEFAKMHVQKFSKENEISTNLVEEYLKLHVR